MTSCDNYCNKQNLLYFVYPGKDLWKGGENSLNFSSLNVQFSSHNQFFYSFLLIVDLKTGLIRNLPSFFITIHKRRRFLYSFCFHFLETFSYFKRYCAYNTSFRKKKSTNTRNYVSKIIFKVKRKYFLPRSLKNLLKSNELRTITQMFIRK